MPFSLQAASEAMHASIFPNHSMAGNDDRYWISARGRPGGADGLGRPCPVGQVGVGDSFSIGDERDFAPDLLLEIGAGQAQRERETFSLSRKIFLELLRRLLKNRLLSIERPTATRGGNVIAADKIHASQGGGVGDQHELTYWAFEDGIVVHNVFSNRLCLFHVKCRSLSFFKISRKRTNCSPFSVMETKLFRWPKMARITRMSGVCLWHETGLEITL